jgi:hypothetical protein
MMEEEYMTLVVTYKNKEDRSFICDIIGDIEEKYNVHPEVIHQRSVDGGGSFSVEFLIYFSCFETCTFHY